MTNTLIALFIGIELGILACYAVLWFGQLRRDVAAMFAAFGAAMRKKA